MAQSYVNWPNGSESIHRKFDKEITIQLRNMIIFVTVKTVHKFYNNAPKLQSLEIELSV